VVAVEAVATAVVVMAVIVVTAVTATVVVVVTEGKSTCLCGSRELVMVGLAKRQRVNHQPQRNNTIFIIVIC
jgi:hypothetical protein